MRVVLVDPSVEAAAHVARLLEARHHEVRTFADGREALAYIQADTKVGAVITGTEPLSISGLELCWEVRLIATAQRPIYVILMAGKDDDQMIVALDSGADDFLHTPLASEELYARLRAAERLARMQSELIWLATTDSLTGMFNRRAFFDKAKEFCARAEAGEPLAAVMIDIDHFKRINDMHGHKAGDEAICAVAQTLSAEPGVVGRLGGEEFALLLHGRTMAEAVEIAERLRAAVAGLTISDATLTCSFGVSEWRKGDTIDLLLKGADMALYDAKLGGRNRVIAADHPAVAPTYSSTGRTIRAEAVGA
jgi:diguanylate cyclase (GGDEF)-like protein